MKPASTTPTVLLLVDVQKGFLHPTAWGTERSTPEFEANVTRVLAAARGHNASAAGSGRHPVLVVHVHHHSRSASSALHPSYKLPAGLIPGGSNSSSSSGEEGGDQRAVDALALATPLADGSEPVLTKHVNSSFIGTDLETRVRAFGARQLLALGLTTDHCVSTTVRMAANLQVLGDDGGPDGSGDGHHGVVVLRDATATHNRAGFDAETVHKVGLASLDGEFAQVRTTDEVLAEVFGVRG